MADVTMPQLGETVTEGTITRWFKQPGEEVALDEVLFEVSTDKVDSEVPSPAAGTLTEIIVAEGETVDVGVVLAVIGDGAAAPAPAPVAPAPAAAPEPAPAPTPAPYPRTCQPDPAPVAAPTPAPVAASPAPVAAPATAGVLLSPVVRRLITENNLDVATISGTGVGGRITRADVESAIAVGSAPAPAPAPAAARSAPAAPCSSARRFAGSCSSAGRTARGCCCAVAGTRSRHDRPPQPHPPDDRRLHGAVQAGFAPRPHRDRG